MLPRYLWALSHSNWSPNCVAHTDTAIGGFLGYWPFEAIGEACSMREADQKVGRGQTDADTV